MHDPENSFYIVSENWTCLSYIMIQVSNVVPRVFLNTDLPHVSQELTTVLSTALEHPIVSPWLEVD